MNYDEYKSKFDAASVRDDIVNWIKNWFSENGKGCKAVVGISGGKDSTVTAALCAQALGSENVIGVLMPNGVQPDISDSIDVVEFLGIPFITIDICDAYNGITNALANGNIYKLQSDGSRYGSSLNVTSQTTTNLPARLRMTALYAVSQSVNGRVANTCNLSENWVGYSTRYGDSAGDFSPLAQMTTDEVMAIGDSMGLPYNLVHKIPSDGLCGKSDEDNLGFTYQELNEYICTGVCRDFQVKYKIDSLHAKNLFKLKLMPEFNYSR